MLGVRLNRILAGTALALILAAPAGSGAFGATDREIEALVPLPDLAPPPPPSAADVGVNPAAASKPATSVLAPQPAPAKTEPMDIAQPAPIMKPAPAAAAPVTPAAPALAGAPAPDAAPVVATTPPAAEPAVAALEPSAE